MIFLLLKQAAVECRCDAVFRHAVAVLPLSDSWETGDVSTSATSVVLCGKKWQPEQCRQE